MTFQARSSAMVGAAELVELIDTDRPLAVEFGMYSSVITILMEELGGVPFGAPEEWRSAVLAALDARDLAVLRPFVTSKPVDLPGSLCTLPHRTRTGLAPLEEDLERIAAIPPDEFAAELPSDGIWDAVARDPARWLGNFARTVRRACEGLHEPWRNAAGAFDREAERVGMAAVSAATPELVATRFPPAMLRLEAPAPHGAESAKRLAMVPMLAGPGASHAWLVDDRLTHIAYPLPETWRLLEGDAPPPASLEGLLGSPRALILRRLDGPLTVGEIAEALIAVPSAGSHHVTALERAGLVTRERQGRQVVVRRTARGTELLTLYDEA